MNGYLRAIFTISYGYLKLGIIKLLHPNGVSFGKLPRISFRTELTIEKNARFVIGSRFNMRGTARIRVRDSGKFEVGNNVSININNMIACHDEILIGNDVQLSPNVQIYDHDHDYSIQGGVQKGKYKTAPIVIGNNVWIGANTVILRGTRIGDNAVIGAGSIVKGEIPPNAVFVQKRVTDIKIGDRK